jgi:hypothetical protein
MEMKKRIYIPVLLVLLLAALPKLALAAAPSPVAIPVCAAQSHDIPYPTADVEVGRANCLDDYPLPYPAADFEGDGISYFGRPTAINSSTGAATYRDSSLAGYAISYPALGDAPPSIEYVIPYPSVADLSDTRSAR